MQNPFFFGYGSLVNRKTHDYPDVARARVHGWRRTWRHTALRPLAYLTATPCEDSEIDGLIASVPGADWKALDHRERAYDRVGVQRVSHAVDSAPKVEIYWVPPTKHDPAETTLPLLMSYLDVVVQGYHAEFGRDGVAEFFGTTDGWDTHILDDRDNPIYPRHQPLSRAERRLVDAHLSDIGVAATGLTSGDHRLWLSRLI